MKYIQNWIMALVFAVSAGGTLGTIATPLTATAACTETKILTIPPWYSGMLDSDCNIKSPSEYGSISNYVWRIALNIVEIMLHIIGYIAVGFIIWGGFQYLISTGSPDKITSAKNTIQNAAIGLLISILSISIVNLVTGAF